MPFSSYVARFTSRKSRQDYHREQAEKALAPAREMLDRHSIPYAVHVETGDRATLITAAARRLRCDEIVMATARKNSLTRLVESSVTDRVLKLTPVPVEVIAGIRCRRGALRYPGGHRGGARSCGGGAGSKPSPSAGRGGIRTPGDWPVD